MINCGIFVINLWVIVLLGFDDLIVVLYDCYGGIYCLFNICVKKGDFKV